MYIYYQFTHTILQRCAYKMPFKSFFDPATCKNGHVSLRYVLLFFPSLLPYSLINVLFCLQRELHIWFCCFKRFSSSGTLSISLQIKHNIGNGESHEKSTHGYSNYYCCVRVHLLFFSWHFHIFVRKHV